MSNGRRWWVVPLAVLALGCGHYRLPERPHGEGSTTNLVTYAYFALENPTWGYPPGYREFLVDRDEAVVFVMNLEHRGPAFRVQGVLHRPDGTPHATFNREVALSPAGSYRFYRHLESFPMSALAPFPGRWTLRLTIDGELAGVYSIDLVDSRARTQRRE